MLVFGAVTRQIWGKCTLQNHYWGAGKSVTSDVMYISLNTLMNHRSAVDAFKVVLLMVMNPISKRKSITAVIPYAKNVRFNILKVIQ